MKKLFVGSFVLTRNNAICDFCNLRKACTAYVRPEISYLQWNYQTKWKMPVFGNYREEVVSKDLDTKKKSVEVDICGDCAQQIADALTIQEIK